MKQKNVVAENKQTSPPFLPRHATKTTNDKQDAFDFQMVLDKLPQDEPRYLVLDWEVENSDGCQLSKIFFVSWVPDTCKAGRVTTLLNLNSSGASIS